MFGGADLRIERGGAMGATRREASQECGDPATVACSICLEAVTGPCRRSTAKLQCGHEFHLDCIGSAFNTKGIMQCPNCRTIEKGNWLYAGGVRSLHDLGMDGWSYDDLYDLNYAEMAFGIHWCPFDRLAHVPSSFEEGESPSIAYPDIFRHYPFTEHLPSYLQLLGPVASSISHISSESPLNGPSYHHHHWTHIPSQPTSVTHHARRNNDLQHFQPWEHRSFHPMHASIIEGGARPNPDGLARTMPVFHPRPPPVVDRPAAGGAGLVFSTSLRFTGGLGSRGITAPIHEHYQHRLPPGGSRIGPPQPPPQSDEAGFYIFPRRPCPVIGHHEAFGATADAESSAASSQRGSRHQYGASHQQHPQDQAEMASLPLHYYCGAVHHFM